MGRGGKSIFIIFVLFVALLFVPFLYSAGGIKITGYQTGGSLEFEEVGPRGFNTDLVLIAVLIVLVIIAIIAVIRFFKIMKSRKEAEGYGEEPVIAEKEYPSAPAVPALPIAPAPPVVRAKPSVYLPKPKEGMTPEKVKEILRKLEEEKGRKLEKRETEELFKKLKEIAKS